MAVSTYLEMFRDGLDPVDSAKERIKKIATLTAAWRDCYPSETVSTVRGPGWVMRERAWVGSMDPVMFWRWLDVRLVSDVELIKRTIHKDNENLVIAEPYDCMIAYIRDSDGDITFRPYASRLLET